jgi:ubiquinone/menaquinone biosynthesis C-methylase UbiE
MPLFDHFQILAPFYDRVIRADDVDDLIQVAGLPTTGVLLDAAGGTARVSNALRRQVDKVVVVDLSSNMLRQARKKGMSETVCSCTEQLPFSEGYFDRIIMVDALHHVYDQKLTAIDLWRVLKTGGRLVIEEPDIGDLRVKIVAFMERLALMRSRFLPPEEIADLFNFPEAKVSLKRQDYNAWIVVRKSE